MRAKAMGMWLAREELGRVCRMNLRTLGVAVVLVSVLSATTAILAQSPEGAAAVTYSVLYSFQRSNDGCAPEAGIVRDAEGNLYGTTRSGGDNPDYDYGTVFKLAPDGTETILHTFTGITDGDGMNPSLATLALDPAGNIYGTTPSGGDFEPDAGIVFKLTAAGVETVLHTFTGTPDGAGPQGGLILDKAGNLYGTAAGGGANGGGNIFRISPDGTETVLYNFKLKPGDGFTPTGSLTRDSAGNFYGTTYWGGSHYVGSGTVFKLTPSGGETVLHSFAGSPNDGLHPAGTSLFQDPSGNLYGVTYQGGSANEGTVFKVGSDGSEGLLLSFNGRGRGRSPYDGLASAGTGNFFGSTVYGGASSCVYVQKGGCGVLFELTASGEEKILHEFGESAGDGAFPYGGVIRDSAGNLYGTTAGGGTYNCGTVFKYTP
jgi:uncharacterized repeat protein (TIGR03803 family)